MYDAHVCMILIVFTILTKNKLPVLGNYGIWEASSTELETGTSENMS